MLWQRPKVRNLGSWGLKSEPEEKKSACNSQRAQPYRHSDMKTGSLGDALARLNDPPGYPHTYRDLTYRAIDIVWLPRFLHGLKEDNLREKRIWLRTRVEKGCKIQNISWTNLKSF